MAKRLEGKAAADRITEQTRMESDRLRREGIVPTLAILRVGENPGDIYYEKGAVMRAGKAGVEVRHYRFPENVDQEELVRQLKMLNQDDRIHGVLIFRPLPPHIDEAYVCEQLDPSKDVDGITARSMAGVFMDTGIGFPPCTAEACMDILDYYGIELEGAKVTVMGRSLVIGKPVAMMAMKRNATVTVLHSRTAREDFAAAGRGADVVIAAMGRARMVGPDQLGTGQIILDVGINTDEEGHLCGDVDFEKAEGQASMITPVPGGIGSMTTAVLMRHVLQAAKRKK